jgi:putative DNA primase/helicase
MNAVEQTTSARPMALAPLWDNFPLDLIACPQWVLWAHEWVAERWTKVPLQPTGSKASSVDRPTWSPFKSVRAACAASRRFAGVGFVLTADDPFVAFDFDHCVEAGRIVDPKIADYVARLDSYTEITPSGTGLRVIVRGKLPGQDRKQGNCECYDDKRFVTITGRRYSK